MKLTIYGASDDLIEIEADGPVKGADEYGDGSCEERPHLFEVVAPDGASMVVRVGFDGCWWVAPCLVSEDVAFPDWPIEHVPAEGSTGSYSLALVLDVPEGTRVIDRMPRLEN